MTFSTFGAALPCVHGLGSGPIGDEEVGRVRPYESGSD